MRNESTAESIAYTEIAVQAPKTVTRIRARYDGIISPAEKIVLDCLRQLQAIPAADRLYVDGLLASVTRAYLDASDNERTFERRFQAITRVASEKYLP
jgi:hypothetical protein